MFKAPMISTTLDVQDLLQPIVLLVLVLTLLLLFIRNPKRDAQPFDAKISSAAKDSVSVSQGVGSLGMLGDTPRLMGTFIPTTGVVESNMPVPTPFENHHCSGEFLALHRPTHDKALDSSGDYPYADHFKGRKRLWETRWTFRFKHDVTDGMRFGIELDQYVPINASTKWLMEVAVGLLAQTAGKELYHSSGDDPDRVLGEIEKPVFTMPMFAFDQIVVTPADEDPPSLTDPAFSDLGIKRSDGRAAFIKEVSNMKLMAGPVYTFAFWGISQFLDVIKWEMQKIVPFKSFDFNLMCKAPPVNLVLYTVKEEELKDDKRHLQDKKTYYFRLAFWSSLKPPPMARLRELLPRLTNEIVAESVPKQLKGWAVLSQTMFGCCAQR